MGPQRVVHDWVTKHKFFLLVVVMHIVLLCARVFSCVWLFVTPWTVACQVALSIGFPRLLEGVAISFSRGSSQPRDQTHISCIGRWILYHKPPGKPLEDRPVVIMQLKEHRKQKAEERWTELWRMLDTRKCTNICIMGIPEEETGDKEQLKKN